MITRQSSLSHSAMPECQFVAIIYIHQVSILIPLRKKKPISIRIYMKEEENPNNSSTKKVYHPDPSYTVANRNHSPMIIDNAKPLKFHHFSIPPHVTKQDEYTIHALSSSLYPSIEVVIQSHLLKSEYPKGRALCKVVFVSE
jgi:hypothetical protein